MMKMHLGEDLLSLDRGLHKHAGCIDLIIQNCNSSFLCGDKFCLNVCHSSYPERTSEKTKKEIEHVVIEAS
jgi:hypothetical protein